MRLWLLPAVGESWSMDAQNLHWKEQLNCKRTNNFLANVWTKFTHLVMLRVQTRVGTGIQRNLNANPSKQCRHYSPPNFCGCALPTGGPTAQEEMWVRSNERLCSHRSRPPTTGWCMARKKFSPHQQHQNNCFESNESKMEMMTSYQKYQKAQRPQWKVNVN